MEDPNSWLNEGKSGKTSKFINQRLGSGEEFTGIYKARRKTTNNYGKTYHYIFPDPNRNGELIFDSKNPIIAALFSSIPFESRVTIRKFFKDGRIRYDVKFLNSLKDEEPEP